MDSSAFRQMHASFGMFCILFSYGFVTGLLHMINSNKAQDGDDVLQDNSYIWKYLFTYFPFAPPITSITAFFISQLATGILSDRYGRRLALSISIAPLFVSCVLLTFTKSCLSLVIVYFIAGLSSGGLSTSLVLVTETSSPKFRVVSINLIPIFFTTGLVSAFYLGSSSAGNILYLYGVVSTACSFLMSLTLPESPYWLAKRGKLSQFKYAFSWYRGNERWELEEIFDNENVEMKEFNLKKNGFINHKIVPEKSPSILSKESLMSLAISLSCILFLLSSSRFMYVSFAVKSIDILPVFTNLKEFLIESLFSFLVVYFIFSFLSSYLRSKLIVVIAGVFSISLYLISAYFLSYEFTQNNLSIKLSLVLVYLFLITFVICPSLMTILLVSLPTAYRGLGVSLVSVVLVILVKIFMFMNVDIFKYVSIQLVIAFNMFVLVLSLCHIFYCAPEPYYKSLAEIEDELKGRRKRRSIFEYSQIVIDEKLVSCPFPVLAV